MSTFLLFLGLIWFKSSDSNVIDYDGTSDIQIISGKHFSLKYNLGSCNTELWNIMVEINGTGLGTEADLYYVFAQDIPNTKYFAFANAFDDKFVIGNAFDAFITPKNNRILWTTENITALGEMHNYRKDFAQGSEADWMSVFLNQDMILFNTWPVYFEINIDTYQETTAVTFTKNDTRSKTINLTSTWDTTDNDLYLFITPDDYNTETFEIYDIKVTQECTYYTIPYNGVGTLNIKSNPGWSMVYNLNNICTKTSWYKTIEVDGLYTGMNSMNENGDLAFAIASNISYIAFLIEFDGRLNGFNNTLTWVTTGMEMGDIISLGNMSNIRDISTNWQAITPNIQIGNTWPLTFNLSSNENGNGFLDITIIKGTDNPGSGLSAQYSDIITIPTTFARETELNLYITPSANLDEKSNFEITSIQLINDECFDTDSPTKAPTTPPTKSPTNSPSITPTKSSNMPTGAPSEDPTAAPTKITDSPTMKPSNTPSESPTYRPTSAPTIEINTTKATVEGTCSEHNIVQQSCPSCFDSLRLYSAPYSFLQLDLSINDCEGSACPAVFKNENEVINSSNPTQIYSFIGERTLGGLSTITTNLTLAKDIENDELILTVFTWGEQQLIIPCQYRYWVSQNQFEGIVSKNLIHFTFFLYNVNWLPDEDEARRNEFIVFFNDTFTNAGIDVIKVEVKVTRGDFDFGNTGNRRRLFADNDNDVQVDVFIFVDSTEDAKDGANFLEDQCKEELLSIEGNTPAECSVIIESSDAPITPKTYDAGPVKILGVRAWMFWLLLFGILIGIIICLMVHRYYDFKKDKEFLRDETKRTRAIDTIDAGYGAKSVDVNQDIHHQPGNNNYDDEYNETSALNKSVSVDIITNGNTKDVDIIKRTENALKYYKNKKKIDDRLSNYLNENDMVNGMLQKKKANQITYDELDFSKSRLLGKGAFGEVKLCNWYTTIVAVKILKADDDDDNTSGNSNAGNSGSGGNSSAKKRRKRTMDERKKERYGEIVLANRIPFHPNLVQYYGYVLDPLCMVMEYMNNGSVQDYIYRKKQNNLLTNTEKITIYKKAAAGIEFLHEYGLIHRDIAARNILLSGVKYNKIKESTKIKISDFGLTRKLEETENNSGKTDTNYGPLKWMAPESIRNKEYSQKSDIYMFGITMWEIWYRMQPYPGTTPVNVGIKVGSYKKYNNDIIFRPRVDQRIKTENKIIEEDMPLFIKQIMEGCWDEIPENRPNFNEIITDLKKDDITI